jgi:hypothetical protein
VLTAALVLLAIEDESASFAHGAWGKAPEQDTIHDQVEVEVRPFVNHRQVIEVANVLKDLGFDLCRHEIILERPNGLGVLRLSRGHLNGFLR